MSCLRFSQSAPTQCRNSQPGITTIYIANFSDKVSYTTNTSGDMISGMTWSGATGTNKAFYSIAQNKQVASCIDTPGLNIANGTFIMKPQVIGKVQGMES